MPSSAPPTWWIWAAVQVNEGKVIAVGAGRRDKDGKPIPVGAQRDCVCVQPSQRGSGSFVTPVGPFTGSRARHDSVVQSHTTRYLLSATLESAAAQYGSSFETSSAVSSPRCCSGGQGAPSGVRGAAHQGPGQRVSSPSRACAVSFCQVKLWSNRANATTELTSSCALRQAVHLPGRGDPRHP